LVITEYAYRTDNSIRIINLNYEHAHK